MWQENRAKRAGVEIVCRREATLNAVMDCGADAVVVATGALPRRPDVPGINRSEVFEIREVMLGTAEVGQRVVLISQDDHLAPLSGALLLAEAGHQVRIIHQNPHPSPLVGRYTVGGVLHRLLLGGVLLIGMERLVAIEAGMVRTQNVYSGLDVTHHDFDSIVLACGGAADDGLFRQLSEHSCEVHVVGDAYAPRRLAFATQQADSLARQL